MKPTDDLRREHGQIKLMLKILENIASRLGAGEAVEAEHLDMAVEFIRGYADKCHHGKEEDYLFPAMKKARITDSYEMIARLLKEHKMGRRYVKAMAAAIVRYKKGNKNARAKIIDNALDYVRLLDPHIDRENSLLFPIADSRLPIKAQQSLSDGFYTIEKDVVGEGRHKELHDMLNDLRDRFLV